MRSAALITEGLPPSGRVRIPLQVLDADVVLHGPVILADAWRQLWRPFLCDELPDGALEVIVDPEPWGYSIRSAGREVNVTDVWRALIESRNDVVRLALREVSDVVQLHAAVVVRSGKAAVLVGDAWAGKTTIALQLVDRGWTYFGDDAALFERATRAVRPLPKPPGVKAQSWDEMRHWWDPVPVALGDPPGPFVIPPPFRASLDDRAQPGALIFLDYRDKGPISFDEVSPGAAVARAGEHVTRLDPGAIALLARLCQDVRAASVGYDDATAAAAILNSRLS